MNENNSNNSITSAELRRVNGLVESAERAETSEVAAAMATAAKELAEARQKKAVETAKRRLTEVDEVVNHAVLTLRELRKQEKNAAKFVATVSAAADAFRKDGDFVKFDQALRKARGY